MAEVEVGGIKFKGGKIFVILTALTTAGGALWGGFEFYKDYLNMKEQIQNYVAPLSPRNENSNEFWPAKLFYDIHNLSWGKLPVQYKLQQKPANHPN